MKIAPICLLTACKRRKFKLFGDSSQVRAIDNGITCCYWSESLSNQLRALKAHSSLFKCCAKNCPNYTHWIQAKHHGSWVWVFLRLFLSLKLIFIVPFNFYSISIFLLIRRGGATGREQPQGRTVTLAGPKSDIGRAEKSHKGQNVTLECYNKISCPWTGCVSSIHTSMKNQWSVILYRYLIIREIKLFLSFRLYTAYFLDITAD